MQMGVVTILALVAVVFSIIELGLTGHMADLLDIFTPDRVAFMVFCSVWSLAVLAYLIVSSMYVTRIYNKMVALGLNAVTMIFWFAGSIALAVVARGGIATAAIVFGFMLWLLFTALTVFDALDFHKNRNSSNIAPKGQQAYVGA